MVFFIMKLNKFSRKITQDESLPAAQAMLYGIGLKDDDFKKAQIGIASTGFEGNPCNMHLNELALQGLYIRGGQPVSYTHLTLPTICSV